MIGITTMTDLRAKIMTQGMIDALIALLICSIIGTVIWLIGNLVDRLERWWDDRNGML